MSKKFQTILSEYGATARMARHFGVSHEAVRKWRSHVPEARVLGLCAALGWRVTPHELRPDFYPHPDDGLPPELRGRPEDAA
ncbi:MAG: transcriptional regulator [Halothiobacillaceae bacterium]